MATADATLEAGPKKGRKKPLLIGYLLAVILGIAGFYAVWSGLILGESSHDETGSGASSLQGIAFVPLDTVVVSLGAD